MTADRIVSAEGAFSENSAQLLSHLTSEFYAHYAKSFSQTRTKPWSGWTQLFELLCAHNSFKTKSYRIINLAAGNLRFEHFLQTSLQEYLKQQSSRLDTPQIPRLEFLAVDNCLPLSTDYAFKTAGSLTFLELDICASLQEKYGLSRALKTELTQTKEWGAMRMQSDLICSFGFMHHIYGYTRRLRFLTELLSLLKPGGILCVSLWQFMHDKRIASQARINAALAQERFSELREGLEHNDYLLGWQGSNEYLRYCHHFDEDEVKQLIKSLSEQEDITLLSNWNADGKDNKLNLYLAFQKL